MGRLGTVTVLAALLPSAGLVAQEPAQELLKAVELYEEGHVEEALARYRRILAGENPDDVRATTHNAVCGALNDLGRYSEALAACDEAEALWTRLGNDFLLADTLNNKALALDALGRPDAARAAYEEALARYRKVQSLPDQAVVLSNLASLAIGRGDLGAALGYIDAAESVARSAAGEDWAPEELRIAHINRAVTLERLGAYREALAELKDAPPGEESSVEGRTLRAVNVAVLYRNLGDPWRALSELDRAEERLAGRADPSTLATIELNRGLVALLGLDDAERARDSFSRALDLTRDAGDVKEEGRAQVALGRAELVLDRAAAAREAFEAALATTERTESAETRWSALAGLGRAAAALGDDAEADARIAEALETLERVGAGLDDAALREGLLADQRDLYAAAVDRRVSRAFDGDAHAALEALALTERSRARELLDALAGATSSEPFDGAALESAAPRIGAALAYFAGEHRIWRFELDPRGSVEVHDAGDAASILADARRVHEELARGRAPEPELLARLSTALLPPAAKIGERLRIVPDDVLFYLPFDLLRLDDGRTLGQASATALAPSLSTLARLGRGEARAPRWDLVAFADPAPPPASAATRSTAGLLASRFGLPPLPAARREAEAAASSFAPHAVVEIGAAATKSALRHRAEEGTRVLLIAAHTLVDERIEGGVGIFLAPEGESDGALSAPEIARLPLAVDLAVLSGCRTALAGHRDGRSMATLAGALLGAGARGVVATLWEVDDAAAEAVVRSFVWELARGTEPAEALRRAKRRLDLDPRWSGHVDAHAFVLLGDPPGLGARAGRRGWLGAALVAFALAAGLWFATRRRARSGTSDGGAATT